MQVIWGFQSWEYFVTTEVSGKATTAFQWVLECL